jgi:hypothetical protein
MLLTLMVPQVVSEHQVSVYLQPHVLMRLEVQLMVLAVTNRKVQASVVAADTI